MANGNGKYDSASSKAKGALARVAVLETALARSLVSIEKRFGEQKARDNNLTEVLEALVEAVGIEQVQEIVNRRAQEKAQSLEANDLAILKSGIDDGYLTSAETISDKSLIIGKEFDGVGNPVGTGRQQISFRGVDPKFQVELAGKGVGTKITTPSGGTFEVMEIYDIDEEKARVVLQAKATKAAQAQAEQDEATEQKSLDSADEAAEEDDGEESTEEANTVLP